MLNNKAMIKLKFEAIRNCEMCGDSTENHKILGQRLNQSQGLNPKKKIGITVSVCRCKNCGLIYSNPQPTPFDIQDHYGVPPEEYWKPEYFKLDPKYFSGEIENAKKLLPFVKGMDALDIGSGIGKCMLSLENAGFNSYGIESSEAFYAKAISEMSIKSDRLKLSMIEDVDYPEHKFDLITFGAVFEHIYHPAKILEKSLKWLKPNGVLHIEVPSSNHFASKLINLYYKLRCTNYVTNLSPMHSPFHLYEFDMRSFEALAEKLDYEIVKYQYYVGPIYFIPTIFHSPLRWYMKKTNTGMQFTIYLKKKNHVES